jgi:RNA recognition motif-containing protein
MSEYAERPLAGAGKKETGMTSIYVGNLPFSATEDQIRELFSAYGTVESVNLIKDRETGRMRGFGFVEMASGGREAIAGLDQRDLDGRQLTVNEARPREERPSRPRRW